jgi:hypothetical protein
MWVIADQTFPDFVAHQPLPTDREAFEALVYNVYRAGIETGVGLLGDVLRDHVETQLDPYLDPVFVSLFVQGLRVAEETCLSRPL